jgi:L-asparaginase II
MAAPEMDGRSAYNRSPMTNLPWHPIFTIERSGMPEVTVFGIISVVEPSSNRQDGKSFYHQVIRVGDVDCTLWTRSLLKPWQLLSHLERIRQGLPDLSEEHFALMMSSHSGEPHHLKLLNEIARIGNLDESQLQCPPSYPLSPLMRSRLKAEGKAPKSIFHNCSGKHFSYLLDVELKGEDTKKYLDPKGTQFKPLKTLLKSVLGRGDDLQETTDGCQLPNYGLSALEIACLYHGLLSPLPCDLVQNLAADHAVQVKDLSTIGGWMKQFPKIIGGEDRLDSRITQGELQSDKNIPIVAKDGADGLLGIAVAPNEKHANGLGIVIKLSSGYEIKHMQIVVGEIFRRLGLVQPVCDQAVPGIRSDHVKTRFHF